MKRITTLFTLFFFVLSIPAPHRAYAEPPALVPASGNPLEVEQVQIPKEFGSIQEYYQAPAGNAAVILIQDAHAIPDAQRNIQNLIGHFQKEYGVGLIAVEGAASSLDAQIFRSFPDRDVLNKTFQEYLEKGELPGSALAAVFNDQKSIYHGIEDWKLYEEGLGYYLSAMQKEPELLERLSAVEKDMEAKKESAYSKELLRIDQQYKAFQENHSDFIPFMKELAKITRPEKGTELAVILEEAEREE